MSRTGKYAYNAYGASHRRASAGWIPGVVFMVVSVAAGSYIKGTRQSTRLRVLQETPR